jgi:hypothetical protein
MSKDTKLLRGQIRQIAKEMLPEMMTSELAESIRRELSKQINGRLDAVVKNIQDTLKGMDDRSKDIQDYIVRASLKPAAASSSSPASASNNGETQSAITESQDEKDAE